MARTKETKRYGLGATAPAADPGVVELQRQVNRFLAKPVPVTGVLDRATATAVVTIVIQRFTRSFVEDPKNREVVRLFADANRHLGEPVPWVTTRVGELTALLRDYGDFIGRPGAAGTSSLPVPLPYLLIGAGVLLMVLMPKRRRRAR